MKKIFIFNDGTGQSTLSKNTSNVARLYNSLPGKVVGSFDFKCDEYKIDENLDYHSIYFEGVGSDQLKKSSIVNNFWESIKELVLKFINIYEGKQIKNRVEDSLSDLEKIWKKGDEIYLVGFSRGAASIRILARNLIKAIPEAEVNYMLLYDTVYSVSAPIKIRNYEEIVYFENKDIGSHVKRCDHLISGDEMRSKFPLTTMNMRNGVRQILFPGCHSDVGGGLQGRGLADISLKFSIDEMKALGVQFLDESLKKLNLNLDPLGEIGWDTFAGTGQSHSPRNFKDVSFLIHKSVSERCMKGGSAPIALASLVKFNFECTGLLMKKKKTRVNFSELS